MCICSHIKNNPNPSPGMWHKQFWHIVDSLARVLPTSGGSKPLFQLLLQVKSKGAHLAPLLLFGAVLQSRQQLTAHEQPPGHCRIPSMLYHSVLFCGSDPMSGNTGLAPLC